ncbi:membrane protein FxsA [Salibacterium salarium]|uniref:Membrane protein FxsA n=1 Tax=Salibacterium salarium TaxID=284579 RepID=A0A428N3D9_9BACI|nr:FxsA family protein [Salibacterium salarium]RSL32964.1 membrane protein FxsA [Salibacterium salarium]
MGRWIVLLLIIVPALEIGVLILSGNTIGIWPTILLIILTGLLGAWLAKREGLETIRTAQLQMQNGEVPNSLVIDGICILIGGTVLLTPGFITDTIGFLLLIPYTRGMLKALLQKLFNKLLSNGNLVFVRRK